MRCVAKIQLLLKTILEYYPPLKKKKKPRLERTGNNSPKILKQTLLLTFEQTYPKSENNNLII